MPNTTIVAFLMEPHRVSDFEQTPKSKVVMFETQITASFSHGRDMSSPEAERTGGTLMSWQC